ncbi:hypothetical protein [Agromyces allii]|nr:hypothetical protein [Agromyces allii]
MSIEQTCSISCRHHNDTKGKVYLTKTTPIRLAALHHPNELSIRVEILKRSRRWPKMAREKVAIAAIVRESESASASGPECPENTKAPDLEDPGLLTV